MWIDVRGLAYRVECHGGGRAPLLLLHGFTGSLREWTPLAARWARRYRVLAVDLPGHGRSGIPSAPEAHDVERVARDLVGLLDALGLERAHVLGYSMGGRIALALAVAHPGRVGAVVLESASPGLADPAERAARLDADLELAARIERDGVRAFVDRWEALPLWASQAGLAPAVRGALRRRRLRNRAEGLAASLRGLSTGRQRPLHAALPGLAMPVLCLAGALDEKFAAIAREMARALPLGELALVPAAGHAVHLETPEPFAELVEAFLASAAACEALGSSGAGCSEPG